MLDRQALDSVAALPITKQTTINYYYFHTVCARYEGTTLTGQYTCISPSPVSEFLMVPVANIDSICAVMSLVRVQPLDTMPTFHHRQHQYHHHRT